MIKKIFKKKTKIVIHGKNLVYKIFTMNKGHFSLFIYFIQILTRFFCQISIVENFMSRSQAREKVKLS